ncbi:MAG: diaminopimelate epimerase [Syntrophales bacterium]|nr:diaminopimelate epimerase [Syntrophales bacterium]
MRKICGSGENYLNFSKMSGHGNDFIVIDNMAGTFDVQWPVFARKVCERRRSIGADGVLLLGKDDHADFSLRIFNADGSEAEMCGNGARCAAAFALESEIADSPMTFHTLAGDIIALVDKEDISIKLMDVKKTEGNRIVTVRKGTVIPLYYIEVGVPHAVILMKDLQESSILKGPLMAVHAEDIVDLGREVRFHSVFSPRGANVDFVEIINSDRIRVRTYERGVEGETLACGTGIIASAVTASLMADKKTEALTVEVPGGELEVRFQDQGSFFSDVWLAGKISWIYEGVTPLFKEQEWQER